MATVIRMDEKAILTMTEKKILEKAFEILDDIYDECRQGGDLEECSGDARRYLETFLDSKDIYEVEDNENTDTVKIIIEL